MLYYEWLVWQVLLNQLFNYLGVLIFQFELKFRKLSVFLGDKFVHIIILTSLWMTKAKILDFLPKAHLRLNIWHFLKRVKYQHILMQGFI